jgi:hypothetical protein
LADNDQLVFARQSDRGQDLLGSAIAFVLLLLPTHTSSYTCVRPATYSAGRRLISSCQQLALTA